MKRSISIFATALTLILVMSCGESPPNPKDPVIPQPEPQPEPRPVEKIYTPLKIPLELLKIELDARLYEDGKMRITEYPNVIRVPMWKSRLGASETLSERCPSIRRLAEMVQRFFSETPGTGTPYKLIREGQSFLVRFPILILDAHSPSFTNSVNRAVSRAGFKNIRPALLNSLSLRQVTATIESRQSSMIRLVGHNGPLLEGLSTLLGLRENIPGFVGGEFWGQDLVCDLHDGLAEIHLKYTGVLNDSEKGTIVPFASEVILDGVTEEGAR